MRVYDRSSALSAGRCAVDLPPTRPRRRLSAAGGPLAGLWILAPGGWNPRWCLASPRPALSPHRLDPWCLAPSSQVRQRLPSHPPGSRQSWALTHASLQTATLWPCHARPFCKVMPASCCLLCAWGAMASFFLVHLAIARHNGPQLFLPPLENPRAAPPLLALRCTVHASFRRSPSGLVSLSLSWPAGYCTEISPNAVGRGSFSSWS